MDTTAVKAVNPKEKKVNPKRADLIFYIAMMAWPTLQFIVFYIAVNFNSFLMAFQKLSLNGEVLEWTFEHMSVVAKKLLGRDGTTIYLQAAKRSFQVYFVTLFIGTPLGLFFSYYIYKKLPFSGGFRVLLFMPSIISGIVMVAMYKYFVGSAVPYISETIFGKEMKLGLLASRQESNVKFTTIMFFLVWSGFGGGVLMYSNAMSGVSQEIVDSAHLDGAMGLREFWYITVPGIWPTLSTFLITGVAGIFTNQAGLYSFFGDTADIDLQTYGYRIYVNTLRAQTTGYPELSAFGLYMTAVALPVTYLVKYLLERFGPSED